MTNSWLLEDYLLSKSIFLAKMMRIGIMTLILYFDYFVILIYYFGYNKNGWIYIYSVIFSIQISYSYALLFAHFVQNNQSSYKLLKKYCSILKILHLHTNDCILWSYQYLIKTWPSSMFFTNWLAAWLEFLRYESKKNQKILQSPSCLFFVNNITVLKS